MQMVKFLNKLLKTGLFSLSLLMSFLVYSQELPGFFYTSEFQKIVQTKKVQEINTVQEYQMYETNKEEYIEGKKVNLTEKNESKNVINYFLDNNGQINMAYYSQTKIQSYPEFFTTADSIRYDQLYKKEHRIDSVLNYTLLKHFHGIDVHGYASHSYGMYAVDTSLTVFLDERDLYSNEFEKIRYEFSIKNALHFNDGKLNGLHNFRYSGDFWERNNFKYEFHKVNDTLDQLYFNYPYDLTPEEPYPLHVYKDTSGISNIYRSEIVETTREILPKLILNSTDSIYKEQVRTFIEGNPAKNFNHAKVEYGVLNNLQKSEFIQFTQSFFYEIRSKNQIDEYYLFNSCSKVNDFPFSNTRNFYYGDKSDLFRYSVYVEKNIISLKAISPFHEMERAKLLLYKKETILYPNGKMKKCNHYFMELNGNWKLIAVEKQDKKTQNSNVEIIECSPLYETEALNIRNNINFVDLYDLTIFTKAELIWFLPKGNFTLNYSDNLLQSIINEEGTPILSVDDHGISILSHRYDFLYESSKPKKFWE